MFTRWTWPVTVLFIWSEFRNNNWKLISNFCVRHFFDTVCLGDFVRFHSILLLLPLLSRTSNRTSWLIPIPLQSSQTACLLILGSNRSAWMAVPREFNNSIPFFSVSAILYFKHQNACLCHSRPKSEGFRENFILSKFVSVSLPQPVI